MRGRKKSGVSRSEGGSEEGRDGKHVRTFYEGEELALHAFAFVAAAAPPGGGGGGRIRGRGAAELVDFVDKDNA